MRARRLLALMSAALLPAAHPSEPEGAPAAFLTHATQKIFAHDSVSATVGPLELVAAQNEYEPMLVVLQPGGRQPYDGVSVAVPGTAIASQASRVGYVSVVNITDCDSLGPGEYPDPLVPDVDSYLGQKRNAFPVSVPAGQNRLLLIELFVPPGTRPGVHAGTVTVTAGGAKQALPFTLEVFAHRLPSTSSLQSDYGMSQRSIFAGHHISAPHGERPGHLESARRLYMRYLDAGLMHRVSGATDMYPWFHLDYEGYVNASGRNLPFGLRGAKLTAVKMPCNTLDGRGCPTNGDPPTNRSWANASTSWAGAVTNYWRQVYSNFSSHGDGREELLYDYSVDEPTGHGCTTTASGERNCSSNFAQIKARAAALRAANSELRSLVTTELCETGKMGANGRCIVPPGLDTVKDDISLWVPMIQCERGPASPPLSI